MGANRPSECEPVRDQCEIGTLVRQAHHVHSLEADAPGGIGCGVAVAIRQLENREVHGSLSIFGRRVPHSYIHDAWLQPRLLDLALEMLNREVAKCRLCWRSVQIAAQRVEECRVQDAGTVRKAQPHGMQVAFERMADHHGVTTCHQLADRRAHFLERLCCSGKDSWCDCARVDSRHVASQMYRLG